MALWINEDCISCGALRAGMPERGYQPGESIYVIDPAKCTECVGAYDTSKCVDVCPVRWLYHRGPEPH